MRSAVYVKSPNLLNLALAHHGLVAVYRAGENVIEKDE